VRVEKTKYWEDPSIEKQRWDFREFEYSLQELILKTVVLDFLCSAHS